MSFTLGFVHQLQIDVYQLQTDENAILLVLEKVFHSCLDVSDSIHNTLLILPQTEIRQTIRILATRKLQSDFCMLHLFKTL